MPTAQDRQYEYISSITGGIDGSKRPDSLEKNQLITADNVYFDDDFVKLDLGYGLKNLAVTGTPMKTFFVEHADGTSHLLLITTTRIYWEVSNAWHYVAFASDTSTISSTTTTGAEVAGATTVTVASATGFSTGNNIAVILDNGEQHETTVTVSGTTFTIDAIPIGRSVANGAKVVRAYVLTAAITDIVDVESIPSLGYTIITNNKDIPVLFDKSTAATPSASDLANLSSSNMDAQLGSAFVAKSVNYFNSYLMFMNVEESGVRKPQRIRWAAIASAIDWDASGGDAGFLDLNEKEDFIVGANKLGPHLVVYKEKSIVRGDWVGSLNKLIDYKVAVTDEGAMNLACIANKGDHHLVFGNNNVYKYAGGFDVEIIGQPVNSLLYDVGNELDMTKRSNARAIYVEELKEFWLGYVTTGNTHIEKLLRYNTITGSWASRDFVDDMTSFDVYKKDSTGTSSILISGVSGGAFNRVFDYDFSTTTDYEQKIPWVVETKDFNFLNRSLYVDHVDILATGSNILIELSKDGGTNYTKVVGNFSPGAVAKKVRIPLDFQFDQFRIRLSGTSVSFSLGSLGFQYYINQEEF